MIAEFLSAARSAAPLLHAPELAELWVTPSALPEFRISGLAGHLHGQVGNVPRFLDAAVPPGAVPMDAVHYYARNPDVDVDSPIASGIRERSEQNAGASAAALAARYDTAVDEVAARLEGMDEDRPILVFDRWALPLGQCLLTRLLEIVVHADDLAVSLNVLTPAFDDDVVDAAVTTLARIAARKRGALPVLRALARRERAGALATAF